MAKEATLVSVRITCPKDGRKYTIKSDGVDPNGWEQDCDVCGSHGGVELVITCSGCGKEHVIELSGW